MTGAVAGMDAAATVSKGSDAEERTRESGKRKNGKPEIGDSPPVPIIVRIKFLEVLTVFFDRNPKVGHGGVLVYKPQRRRIGSWKIH